MSRFVETWLHLLENNFTLDLNLCWVNVWCSELSSLLRSLTWHKFCVRWILDSGIWMYNFSLLPSLSLSYSPISPSFLPRPAEEQQGWMSYLSKARTTPASYLPAQVSAECMGVCVKGGGGDLNVGMYVWGELDVPCWPSIKSRTQ